MKIYGKQLTSKAIDYLIKFRKAKKQETLEIMATGAERKDPTSVSDIAQAFCLREKELGIHVNAFQ